MAVRKVGIIVCSGATQDLDCCSVVCISDLQKQKGAFSRYPAEDTLRLAGIISCAGCPTLANPEKILRKVRSLVQFKITDIHFSSCMLSLCPFLALYTKAIRKAYPEINLVEGTHEEHMSRQDFRAKVKIAFDDHRCMGDVISGKI